MDAIASSVAGVSPDRQAKRVQMNASRARVAKRSKTATIELVSATTEANSVEPKNHAPMQRRAPSDAGKGHLLNIVV